MAAVLVQLERQGGIRGQVRAQPLTPSRFRTPPGRSVQQGRRRLQDENSSRKLADAVAHAIVDDELRPEQAGFIGSLDYFFLTTINERGEPTVSYKGGPVGLAHVVGARRIVFPNYDGNGMFLSMGNVTATSKVGLLFIDMVTPLRVRVQGEAQLTRDAGHLARFPGSNMIVEVDITSVFYNCARYRDCLEIGGWGAQAVFSRSISD